MSAVLNWLKGIDSRFVDSAQDSAINARARQAVLSEQQSAQVVADLVSGKISAEQLAPEVLDHLVKLQRGRQAPEGVTQARQGLGDALGFMPQDGTDGTRQQLVELLRQSGMVADGSGARSPIGLPQQEAQYRVANAVGDLRAVASPGLGVRLSEAQAGLGNALATNAFARGGAYAGVGGGAVAGGMGLTEAGRALLELSGVLDAEDEEGSPMPRS